MLFFGPWRHSMFPGCHTARRLWNFAKYVTSLKATIICEFRCLVAGHWTTCTSRGITTLNKKSLLATSSKFPSSQVQVLIKSHRFNRAKDADEAFDLYKAQGLMILGKQVVVEYAKGHRRSKGYISCSFRMNNASSSRDEISQWRCWA